MEELNRQGVTPILMNQSAREVHEHTISASAADKAHMLHVTVDGRPVDRSHHHDHGRPGLQSA